MIEPSLAFLGQFLADSFEIDKSKVVYADKDSVFRKLSSRKLPLTLPGITYYNTNVSFIGVQLGRRTRGMSIDTNLTQTISSILEVQPIAMEISVGLISSSLNDHLNLVKSYVGLIHNSTFEVSLKVAERSEKINLSIVELSELSTPPEGKEGYDFDRGVFYTLEGGFRLNSFVLFTKDYKLIRGIDYSLYLDGAENDPTINEIFS